LALLLVDFSGKLQVSGAGIASTSIGKKKRITCIELDNTSEASESSLEGALREYMENCQQLSDSDDVLSRQDLQILKLSDNMSIHQDFFSI
jgi:peptide deformylase